MENKLIQTVLKILNQNLSIPTKEQDIKRDCFMYRRGNITIFLDNPNSASTSEYFGENNLPNEHFIARGIINSIPWYATAINPKKKAA